jgi:hypothetical protein
MSRLDFRFDAPRFAIGGAVVSVGAGVPALVPELLWPSAILFLIGLVVLGAGVVKVRLTRPVVVHQHWDQSKIYDALKAARPDAVVRILQTWFPEEEMPGYLRKLYLRNGKDFVLQVLLMDPGTDENIPSDLLVARMALRELSPRDGANNVRAAINSLLRMKEAVERWRHQAPSLRAPHGVNLEIKLYSFMPFGPIYQIDNDVMFVGFYVNYGTSSEGPMLEIRNIEGNHLWDDFHLHLEEGWAAAASRPVHPPQQPTAALTAAE